MNKERILGLIRHVLTFGGGIVVSQGYLDEATATQVIGALVTIAGAVWSFVAPEKQTA